MAESANPEYDKLFLASGYVHPELAQDTARAMGVELGGVEHRRFPNGELITRFVDSVRGKHVVVIQSHAATVDTDGVQRSVNDAIQEQLLMIDAAVSSSASEVTAVLPHMAYARQDRKARGREPVGARVLISQLASVGVKRLVAIDLHSPQTQAIFHGPFDHLTAQPLLRAAVRELVKDELSDCVVVAPDSGSAKMADYHRGELDRDGHGVGIVHMAKVRDKRQGTISREAEAQGVDGRICLIFDDMIDTAGTLQTAAEVLDKSGARRIYVAATHGIFSGDAYKRLNDSPIDGIIVTDTLPMGVAREELGDKLRVISVAPMIGQALHEIITDGSVSSLFDDQNHR